MEKLSIPAGTTFGLLSIVKEARATLLGQRTFIVRCQCGKEKRVQMSNLRSGRIVSCGTCRQIKHGYGQTEIYYRWHAMMNRCYNPKNDSYERYHSKGITVCERWRDVAKFAEDMEASYTKGLQLDRIDNDGDYSPENCHWVTAKQNGRNRGNNVLITYNGKTQPMSAWAEELNMTQYVLWYRLRKAGWSVERAITTPVQKRKNNTMQVI